eukprot:4633202-Alexandrium_andersonii.AAC.1
MGRRRAPAATLPLPVSPLPSPKPPLPELRDPRPPILKSRAGAERRQEDVGARAGNWRGRKP